MLNCSCMESECSKEVQLTARQSNALKNHLNQDSFTPAEVAKISYRQLLHIAGIGEKSIELIRLWLQQYGYDVSPPPRQRDAQTQRINKQVEIAKKTLSKYGYAVIPPEQNEPH